MSQMMVYTRSLNADSRYQVSDFWEEMRVETRDREEERRLSRVL
jgi:hypothetical protein